MIDIKYEITEAQIRKLKKEIDKLQWALDDVTRKVDMLREKQIIS